MEWYHLPERGVVMVNITDIFGTDFENVLTEFEREFSWTGADYFTETLDDGEVEQWVYLLGATKLSTDGQTSTNGSTAESSLVSAARNL